MPCIPGGGQNTSSSIPLWPQRNAEAASPRTASLSRAVWPASVRPSQRESRASSAATPASSRWRQRWPFANAERTREQHQVLERMRTRHSFDAQELPTFRSQRSPSIFSSSADSPSAPRALLLRNACKYPYMQSIMHVCICVWCILYVVTGAFEVRRFTPTSIAARAEATRRTWLCVELRCS